MAAEDRLVRGNPLMDRELAAAGIGPETDPLTRYLAELRWHVPEVRGKGAPRRLADEYFPRLLAAVEAVLELARTWDAASRKVTGILAEAGMPEAIEAAGTPAAGHPRAADLREAITRALTGEGG